MYTCLACENTFARDNATVSVFETGNLCFIASFAFAFTTAGRNRWRQETTTKDGINLSPQHDDVIKWKHFPRYWIFVGESTGHRWTPLPKASEAELWCFLWSAPEQTIEQAIETPVIWDQSRSLWRHCNEEGDKSRHFQVKHPWAPFTTLD